MVHRASFIVSVTIDAKGIHYAYLLNGERGHNFIPLSGPLIDDLTNAIKKVYMLRKVREVNVQMWGLSRHSRSCAQDNRSVAKRLLVCTMRVGSHLNYNEGNLKESRLEERRLLRLGILPYLWKERRWEGKEATLFTTPLKTCKKNDWSCKVTVKDGKPILRNTIETPAKHVQAYLRMKRQ